MEQFITQTDIETYFEWSVEAVRGLDPNLNCAFLLRHETVIRRCAQVLLSKARYVPVPVFRGVVFKSPNVKAVHPHPFFTYLSFTEDENIAKWFADPGPRGFGLGKASASLGDHGYIIKYQPKLDEILFHWQFLNVMPYMNALSQLGIDGRMLPRQKEVIVYQPREPLIDLSPFDPKDPLYDPPQNI